MVKKDIHNFTKEYEKLLTNLQNSNLKNKDTILRYLREAELGKTILKGQKKKIGFSRLLRVGWILKDIEKKWFNKKFEEITEKEMESFIMKLEKGVIKSSKGKAYSEETQITIKKFIKKFFKWLLGNNEIYPDIVKWIDTSYQRAEVNPVYYEEVLKLVNSTPSIKHKALIWILYDCGFRIEELLNVQLKNITQTEDNEISIRVIYSKTKSRTVFIGLKEAKEAILEYLKIHPNKDKPEEYLFEMTYKAIHKYLYTNSKKILDKKITPHMFRHGSATYYAKFLTEYQMCNRYGWSVGSSAPSRYIEFNGLTDKNTPELIKKDIVGKYESENRELKQELALIKNKIGEVDSVMNKLISNPKILDMLSKEASK